MLANKEGQRVPNVTFRTRSNGEWLNIQSDDLFKNRRVIVFSLPGAFTPTCSSTHLPRYNELADVFKKNGIDEILCLSVNDAFVMEAWGRDQHAENIVLIPDGNGEFTGKLDLLVDKSDLGFGKRSWRYSMLVNNGVIEKQFLEPEKPGDPFEVSDADTMLRYINPKAALPDEVTIITKPGCNFCLKAKKLLSEHQLNYEEIELGGKLSYKSLRNLTGENTAPQIFINGKQIKGLDGLEQYFTEAQL